MLFVAVYNWSLGGLFCQEVRPRRRREGEGNESHQRLELAHGEERANEEEATEGTGEKAKERSLLED